MIDRLPAAWGHERTPAGVRTPLAAELVAFGALAALVTASWLSLITNPPVARGIAAVVIAVAAAWCLGTLGGARMRPALAAAATVAVAIATTLGGMLAMGLSLHDLVPSGWGDLRSGLATGIPGAVNAGFPYTGADPWTRLVIVCGLPLVLGAAVALGFGPGSRRRSRAWGLVAPATGFAIAISLSAPSEPLVWGLALFAAMAAWLWLGRTPLGTGAPAGALLLAAAVVALPLASALNRGAPILDYQNWNLSISDAQASSISYTWDHTYGPLTWPRTGRTLLTVTGTGPEYWRTTVLDEFDGIRWAASSAADNARFELPATAERAFSLRDRIAALDPRWVNRATVHVDALSSQLVVAPGGVLKLGGGLAITSGGPSGLMLPPDQTLSNGDTYTVVAYEPNPSASDLRTAPRHLDPGLRQFTEIELPKIKPAPPPTDASGQTLQRGVRPLPSVSLRTIEMPVWGSSGGNLDRHLLARSAYGSVYALAKRVTAGTSNEYAAVRAIERHLRTHYSYSETPPVRELPLRAFLFRDRRGYCQQFSGAMALMLRTLGIPARVASGFSPGVPNPHGNGWAIRDLDAHSWVEVYFNGIGWVPFDPTPAAAPAGGQSPGGGALPAQRPSRQLAGQPGGPAQAITTPVRPGGAGGTPWWLVVIALGGALLGAAALVAIRRRRRFLALGPAEAIAIQARELGVLVRRLDLDGRAGITLLDLERRLRTLAGGAAGDYPRAVRLARYGAGSAAGPSLRDRRDLRRALFGHGGSYRYLAGLAALPPGGPR